MFTSTEKIQAKLPALNIKGIVPIPNNEIRLDIESPAALKALKEAGGLIGIVAARNFVSKNKETTLF